MRWPGRPAIEDAVRTLVPALALVFLAGCGEPTGDGPPGPESGSDVRPPRHDATTPTDAGSPDHVTHDSGPADAEADADDAADATLDAPADAPLDGWLDAAGCVLRGQYIVKKPAFSGACAIGPGKRGLIYECLQLPKNPGPVSCYFMKALPYPRDESFYCCPAPACDGGEWWKLDEAGTDGSCVP